MKHRVRTHHWKDGHHKHKDYWFENFSSALQYAKVEVCEMFKIYDDQDQLIYAQEFSNPDYA